jgi:hypothetical protein
MFLAPEKALVAQHDDRLSGQTTSCNDGHPPCLHKPSSANGQQTQGNQTTTTFVGQRLPFWGFCLLATCSSFE